MNREEFERRVAKKLDVRVSTLKHGPWIEAIDITLDIVIKIAKWEREYAGSSVGLTEYNDGINAVVKQLESLLPRADKGETKL